MQVGAAVSSADRLATDSRLEAGLRLDLLEVAGHLSRVSELLDPHGVEAPMDQAVEACLWIADGMEQLAWLSSASKGGPGASETLLAVFRDSIESADRATRDGLAALFADDLIDPRAILQWKEIFESLSAALAVCRRVAARDWCPEGSL